LAQASTKESWLLHPLSFIGSMSAFIAGSPMAHGSPRAFKSPLRNFRADSCEVASSEEVFADAQARLVQWRKDFTSDASFDAQQGLRDLHHEKEHLKDLQADLAGVKGLVQVATQLQAGGSRLAEVLHSSSEKAAMRAQDVGRMTDELSASNETHRQELQQAERRNEQQRAVADAQHAEALKLLAVYQERLGLAITRVAPQTVRMAFSLLDDCDASREFHFTLGLGDADEKALEGYSVRECLPQVPELSKLLAELNKDASSATALPRFVCSMRRSFLKTIGAAKA